MQDSTHKKGSTTVHRCYVCGEGFVQRDMVLVRAILEHIHERTDLRPKEVELDDYDQLAIDRHVNMLFDCGFVEGIKSQRIGPEAAKVRVTDMSMAGHDFLGALRNQDVWAKLTSSFSPQEMSSFSLKEIKELAGDLLSVWARKKLGLD